MYENSKRKSISYKREKKSSFSSFSNYFSNAKNNFLMFGFLLNRGIIHTVHKSCTIWKKIGNLTCNQSYIGPHGKYLNYLTANQNHQSEAGTSLKRWIDFVKIGNNLAIENLDLNAFDHII